MSDREQRIRERAYYLWEAAGRPADYQEDFWLIAEREMESAVPEGDRPAGAMEATVAVAALDRTPRPVRKTAARAKR